MEDIQKVLNNPLLRQGLKMAAPEIALGVELLVSFGSAVFGRRAPSSEKLVKVIDKRLAEVLNTLATTKSKYRRKECEIRAHELLGILNDWEKIT